MERYYVIYVVDEHGRICLRHSVCSSVDWFQLSFVSINTKRNNRHRRIRQAELYRWTDRKMLLGYDFDNKQFY